MQFRHIGVEPLAGALGAEVSGIRLSGDLGEAVMEEIHAAWLQYQVLFFRDQDLSPEQHIGFARHFGKLQKSGYMPTVDGYPDIFRQEYPDLYGGLTSDITWHIDASFLEYPLKGAVLHALDVPPAGGDTAWVNLYAAYEALSAPMRDFLASLDAVHDNFHANLASLVERLGAENFAKARKATPPRKHPLVTTHPETGRQVLFFSQLMVSNIDGLSARESDALVAFLANHIQRPEFQVRFRWQPGSVAFWDNRCTCHKGIIDFGKAHRLMHRAAIRGDTVPSR